MKGLRIHVLIDALAFGGAETLLADFATALRKRDATLTVGYLKETTETAERLRRQGVEPQLVGIRSLLKPRDAKLVRDHLSSVSPDLLHTHLGYSDFLGGRAARQLGIPAVSTLHVMEWERSLRARSKDRLMGFARRHCDARVIAVSDAARQSYLRLGWDRPDRVVTVHNGVAGVPVPERRAQIRRELGLEPDDLVVAMVSVLRPGKGHDVAAGAVASLRARFPRLRLLVAGDGPNRDEVLASMEVAGDAVVPVGFRDDVMAVLGAVDLLIHPSRVDALPTALIEAMAASVPVVATAVGGIPEIVVPGETGVLLEGPPDADRLAAATEGLLADPAKRRRLGAEGRRRFDERFSLDAWMDRLRPIYEAAIAERSRA